MRGRSTLLRKPQVVNQRESLYKLIAFVRGAQRKENHFHSPWADLSFFRPVKFFDTKLHFRLVYRWHDGILCHVESQWVLCATTFYCKCLSMCLILEICAWYSVTFAFLCIFICILSIPVLPQLGCKAKRQLTNRGPKCLLWNKKYKLAVC